jgi:hypothetical protein
MCRYLKDDESVAVVKKASEEKNFKYAATNQLRRFHDKRQAAAHNR